MKHFGYSSEHYVPLNFYLFFFYFSSRCPPSSILFPVEIVPIEPLCELKVLFRDYDRLHTEILNSPRKWGKGGDLAFPRREFRPILCRIKISKPWVNWVPAGTGCAQAAQKKGENKRIVFPLGIRGMSYRRACCAARLPLSTSKGKTPAGRTKNRERRN